MLDLNNHYLAIQALEKEYLLIIFLGKHLQNVENNHIEMLKNLIIKEQITSILC